MTKEKSSSAKKKKAGDSAKKATTSAKKNTTSTASSVKTKSGSKKAPNGSMTKTSKQAVNSKQPPQSKVAKTVNKKTGNASKKASTNKSTAKNKTKPKAKMVAKPKPTEEEETTESEPSEDVVQVVQSKKEDKKKPKAKAPPSKATKNKTQLPQVKPVEVQEADEEAEQEPVVVEASSAEPTEIEASQTEQETCETSAAESSANQTEAVGEEVEEGTETEPVEEEKPKEEKPLEFTKPTINQIKKDKKEKPLSMSEKIAGREFESLNDGITDLNSGVQMLKHSYGSIIKSLVAMQNRRSKKKAAKEAQEKVAADGKPINFLTTMSTADPNELKTKSCLEATDKYDIERFLNPITRDETFNALFEEVDELNKQTEKLRTSFFDPRGSFQRDKYDAQNEVKLDRAQFNEYKLWTKKLASIVDDIARNYNDDLLNMFRLT